MADTSSKPEAAAAAAAAYGETRVVDNPPGALCLGIGNQNREEEEERGRLSSPSSKKKNSRTNTASTSSSSSSSSSSLTNKPNQTPWLQLGLPETPCTTTSYPFTPHHPPQPTSSLILDLNLGASSSYYIHPPFNNNNNSTPPPVTMTSTTSPLFLSSYSNPRLVDHFKVINPPPSRHPLSGLWFMLLPSSLPHFHPQSTQGFSPRFLRIKDGRMRVGMVIKYLANKLGLLETQSQVEIRCRGQVLDAYLTLEHVRDRIWYPCSSVDQTITLLPNSSTSSHLMLLHYSITTFLTSLPS